MIDAVLVGALIGLMLAIICGSLPPLGWILAAALGAVGLVRWR